MYDEADEREATASTSRPASAGDARAQAAPGRPALRALSFEEGERMMAPVEPEPSSTADPAALDQARTRALSAELVRERDAQHAESKRLDAELERVTGELEGAASKPDAAKKAELDKEKADLERAVAAADKRALQAQADLDTLASPAKDQAQINDVMARRQVSVAGVSEGRVASTKLDDQGLTRSTTSSRSAMDADGAAVTTTRTDALNVGLTGGSLTSGASQKTVLGDRSASANQSSTQAIDLTKGSYSSAKQSGWTVEGPEGTVGRTQASATSFGADGLGRSDTTTNISGKDGKDKQSTSVTSKVTRKDGDVGVAQSVERKRDNADGSGSSASAGAAAAGGIDKDGARLGGTANAAASKKTKSGLEVSGGAAAGGRATYSIKPKDGGAFAVQIGIRLDASLSGGLGKGGDSAKVNAKISGSAAVTASYGQTLGAEAAAAWKESLKAAEGGSSGSRPEFQLIATGVTRGWADARALYDRMQGDVASMQEGDTFARKIEGEVGGEVGAEGSSGLASVGASVGKSEKREVDVSISKTDKAWIAGATITATSTTSASGKVGFGAVGMSAGGSNSSTSGKGYSFNIPLDYPCAQGIVQELSQIRTRAALEQFAARHANLLGSKTNAEGDGAAREVGMNVGPVSGTLKFGGSASVVTTEEYDPETGEVVKVDRAHSGDDQLGGEVAAGPLKWQDNSNQQVQVNVTKTKDKSTGQWVQSASGDVSDTDTSSAPSLDESLNGLVESDGKDLLTGKAPLVRSKEKKEVAGFFMDDGDFQALYNRAKKPATWNGSLVKGDLDEWAALGAEIRSSGGDRDKIAAAMTRYKKETGGDQTNANLADVLSVHDGKLGDRYEFPDGVPDLRGPYLEVVVNDPTSSIDALAKAGKMDEALEQVRAIGDKVGRIETTLLCQRAAFKNADVYAEMLRRTGARAAALKTKQRELTAKANGVEVDPAMLERASAGDRFNFLIDFCKAQKDKETEQFNKIEKLDPGDRERVDLVNELRRSAPTWREHYAEMCKLVDLHGMAANKNYLGYRPDEARLKIVYDGGKPWGDEANDAEQAVTEQMQKDKQTSEANLSYIQGMSGGAGPSHAEILQAQKAAAKRRLDERRAAVRASEPGVNAARMTAALAKGKCNSIAAKGGSGELGQGARKAYSDGFRVFNEAEAEWKQAAAKGNAESGVILTVEGIGKAVAAVIKRFNESAEHFRAGDKLS